MGETKPAKKIIIICLLALVMGLVGLALYLAFGKTPQVTVSTYFDKDRVVAVVSQGEAADIESARALRDALERYGSYGEGGAISHYVLGTEGCEELGTCLTKAVEDHNVKALVVLKAGVGTAKAFMEIRKKHPHLMLLASEPEEDPGAVSKDATLVVGGDHVARAYNIPMMARSMGARTIVRLCRGKDTHSVSEGNFLAVMDKVASDNGLKINEIVIPPTVDSPERASDYVRNFFPEWIYRFTPFTLFFTCEDILKEPLLNAVIHQGGFFLEGFSPSPYVAYPEVLGVKGASRMDPEDLIAELGDEVIEEDYGARLGASPSSMSYELGTALMEFAFKVLDGYAKPTDFSQILSSGTSSSPWHLKTYQDPLTRREVPHSLMVYQDPLILGMGMDPNPQAAVPQKYNFVYAKRPLSSFHIGILTSDTGQSRGDLLGAMEMIRRYGKASEGGLISHESFHNDFTENVRGTQALVEGFLEDPLLKVIVINQGIPGVAQGLATVMAERPDIFIIVSQAHEDLRIVAQVSDLIVVTDFVARGYLIPHSARVLGAEAFVHISFPRHMKQLKTQRRHDLMKLSCQEQGIKFYEVEGLDPTGPGGLEAATEDILQRYPGWLESYGPKTAFYSTNDSHAGALISSVIEHGGYFVEADIPSPLTGYPEAMGIPVKEDGTLEYWPKYVKLLEERAVRLHARGRLGTWVYPSGFTMSAGSIEFGRRVMQGETEPGNTVGILSALESFTPGTKWTGTFFVDVYSGRPLRDILLIYQDTYILGKGFLHTPEVNIPYEYQLTGFAFTNEQRAIIKPSPRSGSPAEDKKAVENYIH
ncbi:MAG: DUF3798 domain-containing protein [Deltaproteobacteria bacterium]|nr:DUF3798 domain-containing protein [Deltaproteobacteria bacterium]